MEIFFFFFFVSKQFKQFFFSLKNFLRVGHVTIYKNHSSRVFLHYIHYRPNEPTKLFIKVNVALDFKLSILILSMSILKLAHQSRSRRSLFFCSKHSSTIDNVLFASDYQTLLIFFQT